MKKGFMNKKAMDMTGLDLIKFTGWLTVILTVLWIPMYWMIFKLDEIIDVFESIRAKINSKLRFLYWTWTKHKPEEA